MKRGVLVLLAGLLVLTACKNEKAKEADQAALPSCGAAVLASATPSSLPQNFPTLSQVTYTGEMTAGPSTIVTGYWSGDLDAAFSAYKSAFSTGGYQLAKTEMDVHDAEVNFTGPGSSGQVKLQEQCQGRVNVTLTIRPG